MHFAAEPVYWMNHHDSLFDQPNTFLPRRHLSAGGHESESNKVGILFTPFGYGRHSCLGERFALLQLATVVRTLVRYYSVEFLTSSSPTVSERQISTTLRPAAPFLVRALRK